MFCGAKGLKNVDAGEPRSVARRKNASKNPYSARGLDKFSSLLAELEARRARIMAGAGAQGATMVRFTYSGSNDWIPIIVKLRDPTPDAAKKPPPLPEKDGERGEVKEMAVPERKAAEEVICREGRNRRKSCCWQLAAAVVVAMLLCLVVLGKVFAICCTTVGWYMVPVVQGKSGGAVRRSFKKKDGARRLTPLQINKGRGAQEMTTPRGHRHGRRSCT